jgi:hypothetical protein
MAEETKKEENIEETLKEAVSSNKAKKEADSSSQTNKGAQKELETSASEATPKDLEAAAQAEEYKDPVTEEYLINRNNMICPQWSLTYELWPQKNTTINLWLGF